MPGPLTANQKVVVDHMRGGKVLVWGEYGAYVEISGGSIPVDGRTAQGLYQRGLLKCEGGEGWPSSAGLYILREDKL